MNRKEVLKNSLKTMHWSGFTLTEDSTHVAQLPPKTKGFTLAGGATSKAKGFTLAEVLITLGIIGVVAAMTIPTLIANTRSQQYRSQFKKTLSTLNQAARMAQAQYDFDFGDIDYRYDSDNSDCANENPNTDKTMCALLNGTLSGANYAFSGAVISDFIPSARHAEGSTILVYQLADGAQFGFQFDGVNCNYTVGDDMSTLLSRRYSHDSEGIVNGLAQCIGFIDVNGDSKPNKEVECADGDIEYDPSTPCKVDNASIGDRFPVVFHDGTVEPATNAAAYVLSTSK